MRHHQPPPQSSPSSRERRQTSTRTLSNAHPKKGARAASRRALRHGPSSSNDEVTPAQDAEDEVSEVQNRSAMVSHRKASALLRGRRARRTTIANIILPLRVRGRAGRGSLPTRRDTINPLLNPPPQAGRGGRLRLALRATRIQRRARSATEHHHDRQPKHFAP
jgi:hypothetical protein